MDVKQIELKLKKAWSLNTSSDPDNWSPQNPSHGQCAVTALVVNDYLGGIIVHTDALLPNGEKVSHYFNLIDGEEFDLTREQFPEGTIIGRGREKKNGFSSTRAYCLSYDKTKQRYKALDAKIKMQ